MPLISGTISRRKCGDWVLRWMLVCSVTHIAGCLEIIPGQCNNGALDVNRIIKIAGRTIHYRRDHCMHTLGIDIGHVVCAVQEVQRYFSQNRGTEVEPRWNG